MPALAAVGATPAPAAEPACASRMELAGQGSAASAIVCSGAMLADRDAGADAEPGSMRSRPSQLSLRSGVPAVCWCGCCSNTGVGRPAEPASAAAEATAEAAANEGSRRKLGGAAAAANALCDASEAQPSHARSPDSRDDEQAEQTHMPQKRQ